MNRRTAMPMTEANSTKIPDVENENKLNHYGLGLPGKNQFPFKIQ